MGDHAETAFEPAARKYELDIIVTRNTGFD